MKPSESFVGQPVRALQTMLRVIALHDNRYSAVVPDGIFGPQTMQAVSAFQKIHRLPPTGVVNQQTWNRILETYEPAAVAQTAAQSIPISLEETLRSGDKSSYIALAQCMLSALAYAFSMADTPKPSGVLDSDTERALRSFQTISALPCTGELDKRTWKHLSLQFYNASGPCQKTKSLPIFSEYPLPNQR